MFRVFQATGIILAGGSGSRMNGADKSQLVVNNRPMLDRNIEKLRKWFSQVLIVTNRQRCYDYPDVKQIIDERAGCGPLMGLYSGLRASGHKLNFVMACDMPHVSQDMVQLLMDNTKDADVVVPMINGYYEPLLAIYNKSVIPAIEESIENELFKVVDFYDKVRVGRVKENEITAIDPELLSFMNINTTHDLHRARQVFGKQHEHS